MIENKIKSGLNGQTDDGRNQLDKYYEYTEDYKKKDNDLKNAYYYLFAPDDNDILIDGPISQHYKIIYYSEIYNFFCKNAVEYINEKNFPEFISALKKQTMTNSELRFSIMKSRFLEKINQK